MTQVPSMARRVDVAATVRAVMHSRAGPCQKRWSVAHRASTPATLRGPARLGQLGHRIDDARLIGQADRTGSTIGTTNGRNPRPGRMKGLRKGRENESDRPEWGGWSYHGHTPS